MSSRVWKVYSLCGLALCAAYYVVPHVALHPIYDVVGLSSVVAVVVGVIRNKPAFRWPWYLLALGQLGFVVGDMIRAFYEEVLNVTSPFPGPADVAYLAAYPIMAAALILFVRSRDRAKDRAGLIDTMIIVTGVGLISWVYLIVPYTNTPDIGWLELTISVAYPLLDLVLLGTAARLMFSPGVRPPAYYLILVSLLGLMASDSFYTFGLLNETYHTGSIVDLGWLVSYISCGAAALHPSMVDITTSVRQREISISRQRLALLTAASLLAPGVRILEIVRGHLLPAASTVVPTVILFALVMLRMSGVVKALSGALERHREAERLRRQSEARFGSLVQHASDLVTVIDADGYITFQSPSAKRVLGRDPRTLTGRPLVELIHEHDRDATLAVLAEIQVRPSEVPGTTVFRCRHDDGTWRDVEATVTNLLNDPTVGGVVLNGRDVTEQTALQAQLTHQAFHDPLTDLANRALFSDRVEHALDRRNLGDHPIAVMFLDVDDFKTVNDSLGHSAGDELLVGLSARIRSCLRAADTAARLGGDEFAILLEDTDDAERVATRIGESLQMPFNIDGKDVFITVSIGISISEIAQGGADEILRNADAAMYVAKSGGKARSIVFRPEMHLRALKRLDLEGELRRAIEREEFRLHYQPLVDVQTGKITGFEALVRWAHPERGLLGPAEFIAVAEDSRLILPIGRWVVDEAVRQAIYWDRRYPQQPLTMSVNLSAPELAARDILDVIRRALGRGLDPSKLVLEMTERVLMTNTDATIAKLEELKALGVKLSVDDFGTGFSSLSYLRNFPIDALKIAKPFMDGIPEGEQETALVRGILELGHNLDLEVVAEGIERAEQWQALQEMGCDIAQGYLLARPQGPERIEHLLEGVVLGGDGRLAEDSGALSPAAALRLGGSAA